MAFLFPGKTRPGMPGGPTGIQPPFEPVELEKIRRAESWLAESPGRTAATQARTRGILEGTRAAEAGFEAEKYERGIRARPYHEFMRPGPAREAAEARAAPAGERGRRAGEAVRRRAAASVGRVLRGRGAGTIERALVTTPSLEALERDPWSAERVKKLRAYRGRERKRKATARAGKKSVLRGRGRYGTRR